MINRILHKRPRTTEFIKLVAKRRQNARLSLTFYCFSSTRLTNKPKHAQASMQDPLFFGRELYNKQSSLSGHYLLTWLSRDHQLSCIGSLQTNGVYYRGMYFNYYSSSTLIYTLLNFLYISPTPCNHSLEGGDTYLQKKKNNNINMEASSRTWTTCSMYPCPEPQGVGWVEKYPNDW